MMTMFTDDKNVSRAGNVIVTPLTLSSAETRMFQENYDDTMASHVQDSCVAMSSETMILSIQEK